MKKILIADDEAYIRELLLTTLEVANYNILTAKDGQEALKTLVMKNQTLCSSM